MRLNHDLKIIFLFQMFIIGFCPEAKSSLCEELSAIRQRIGRVISGDSRFIESRQPALSGFDDMTFALAALRESTTDLREPLLSLSQPKSAPYLKFTTRFPGTVKISNTFILGSEISNLIRIYGAYKENPTGVSDSVLSSIAAIYRQGATEPVAIYELWESPRTSTGISTRPYERLHILSHRYPIQDGLFLGPIERYLVKTIEDTNLDLERIKHKVTREFMKLKFNLRPHVETEFGPWNAALDIDASESLWTQVPQEGIDQLRTFIHPLDKLEGQWNLTRIFRYQEMKNAPTIGYFLVWELPEGVEDKAITDRRPQTRLIFKNGKKLFAYLDNPYLF